MTAWGGQRMARTVVQWRLEAKEEKLEHEVIHSGK